MPGQLCMRALLDWLQSFNAAADATDLGQLVRECSDSVLLPCGKNNYRNDGNVQVATVDISGNVQVVFPPEGGWPVAYGLVLLRTMAFLADAGRVLSRRVEQS